MRVRETDRHGAVAARGAFAQKTEQAVPQRKAEAEIGIVLGAQRGMMNAVEVRRHQHTPHQPFKRRGQGRIGVVESGASVQQHFKQDDRSDRRAQRQHARRLDQDRERYLKGMKAKRGGGVANPVVIPDLSGSPMQLKISRAAGDPELETFISGLIEAEFDGHQPSALTLASVGDYVRALSLQHCPEAREQEIKLADYLSDARAAMQAALYAHAAEDPIATRLMLASARTALGLIDERYAEDELAAARAGLRAADRELAAIQAAVDAAASDLPTRITAWVATMPRWTKILESDEPRSLFNAELLTAQTD